MENKLILNYILLIMNLKSLVTALMVAALFLSSVSASAAIQTGDVPAVPKSYYKEANQRGVMDTLKYKVNINGKSFEKEALVYLPYGYDANDTDTKYNVLYLAHGGNDNPGSFFSKERTAIPLNQIADHLIETGRMNPIIIVSASYYPPKNGEGPVSMDNTIADCRNFHKEMRRDIIPAVGAKYNTYLPGSDDAAITASRKHRAYGGFSMGALSTWYELAFDSDAFSRFIPLSGDLWIYDEAGNKKDARSAAEWLNSQLTATPWRENDIQIYAYTGSDDIAYKPELELVEAISANAPLLQYSPDIARGNIHFSVFQKGVHTYDFVNQYLMNVMPMLWQKERTTPFALGADIGGTTLMESHGGKVFNINGEERETTQLMKELGMDAIRLRVWVNPKDGFCSKEDVLKMAKRAKENGMDVMLTMHYSDSWADPGKQPVPEAWKNYDYAKMKRAVAKHTEETLQLLKKNDINVRWIQLGNETTHGMLWNMGRAETNMKQYAGLSDAAYAAAKKVFPDITCIVHLDCGMDLDRYLRIFEGFNKYQSRYDMIGMSVYPYWDMQAGKVKDENETILKVCDNIKTLAKKYGKPVMITETGYESARPNEGYRFMRKLIDNASAIDECKGVFYWEPTLEGHYPLGAFTDHKPTKILDAFSDYAYNREAQDTTFYSTRQFDCSSENGRIVGTFYMPYESSYMKKGKLPIVIMSHGFGGNYHEVVKYAECMASYGIAAYVFDFCGGGMNSRSEGKTTDMSVFTEKTDLEAIIRRIKSLPNINHDEIMLLGCSQGALVSTITAAANRDDVKALILMYPALGIPESADAMLERSKDNPTEIEFWGMKMSQKYYREIKGLNPYERIRGFNRPVLLVYGEKDGITPGSSVEKFRQSVPQVKALMIDDGEHGFPYPAHHRMSETYLLDFVRSVLK